MVKTERIDSSVDAGEVFDEAEAGVAVASTVGYAVFDEVGPLYLQMDVAGCPRGLLVGNAGGSVLGTVFKTREQAKRAVKRTEDYARDQDFPNAEWSAACGVLCVVRLVGVPRRG